jgi:glycosidase
MRLHPGLPDYKCFGYFGGMPKVNMRNPDVAAYFTDVALYWLRTARIDGWRLDVADEIAHDFWRGFRKAVKAEFPDALIVGEIWHHAPDFLQGDQWDSVMNYPFYRSVLDFAATDSITASQFLGNLGFLRGNTHTAAYPLLWNLAGSHDTARLRYLCGENPQRQKLAAALQLLHPGMPMIYYGDEVGMTGGPDPDCRRGMLWNETRQDQDMLRWYRRLLQLRREMPQLLLDRPVAEEARDEEGLILRKYPIEGRDVTLLFHAKEGSVCIPELAGSWDLLAEQGFDGVIHGIGAMVLAQNR